METEPGYNQLEPAVAVIHGACLVFLDGLGAGEYTCTTNTHLAILLVKGLHVKSRIHTLNFALVHSQLPLHGWNLIRGKPQNNQSIHSHMYFTLIFLFPSVINVPTSDIINKTLKEIKGSD